MFCMVGICMEYLQHEAMKQGVGATSRCESGGAGLKWKSLRREEQHSGAQVQKPVLRSTRK